MSEHFATKEDLEMLETRIDNELLTYYAFKHDLAKLDKDLRQEIKSLEFKMLHRFDEVGERLHKLETKMDSLEKTVTEGFASLNKRVTKGFAKLSKSAKPKL